MSQFKLSLCECLVFNPVTLGVAVADGSTARFQTCQPFRINPI